MSSLIPSLDSIYDLFKSHLLGNILGLPWDSPLLRHLLRVLASAIYQFSTPTASYYQEELTYVDTEEDGSILLKELHPTYIHLIMALY